MRAGCDIILLGKNGLLQVGWVIYDETAGKGTPIDHKIPRLLGVFLRGLHRPGCTPGNSARGRFHGHRRCGWFCRFLAFCRNQGIPQLTPPYYAGCNSAYRWLAYTTGVCYHPLRYSRFNQFFYCLSPFVIKLNKTSFDCIFAICNPLTIAW